MDKKNDTISAEKTELSAEQMESVTGGARLAFASGSAPSLPYRLATDSTADIKVASQFTFDDQKVLDNLKERLPGRGGEMDDTHGYVVF